jgi:hypothetical protein
LNLAADSKDLKITVDYAIPIPALYTQVAARTIQHHRSLNVLKSAGQRGNPTELPSWVPDWTIPAQSVILTWSEPYLIEGSFYEFYAGGYENPSFAVDSEARILTIKGTVIDTIELLSESVCVRSMTAKKGWRSWFQQMVNMFSAYSSPTGETVERAIWMTLIAGRTHDRRKAADCSYETYYHAWRDHVLSMHGECMTKQAKDFERAIFRGLHMRQICKTEGGYIGLVPHDARVGDRICIAVGARTPYALRAQDQDYVYIGESYIHGLMDAEALELDSWQPRDITII